MSCWTVKLAHGNVCCVFACVWSKWVIANTFQAPKLIFTDWPSDLMLWMKRKNAIELGKQGISVGAVSIARQEKWSIHINIYVTHNALFRMQSHKNRVQYRVKRPHMHLTHNCVCVCRAMKHNPFVKKSNSSLHISRIELAFILLVWCIISVFFCSLAHFSAMSSWNDDEHHLSGAAQQQHFIAN